MEAMEDTKNGCFFGDDDDEFLNFTLDEKEEEEEENEKKEHSSLSSSSSSSSYNSSCLNSYHDDDEHHHHNLSFPSEFEEEEELEWLSNIDAFPSVETFLDILPVLDYPSVALDHHSPVSVVEDNRSSYSDSQNNGNGKGKGNANGSSIKSFFVGLTAPISYPVGKRSKRKRRQRSAGFPDFSSHRNLWLNQVSEKKYREELVFPPLPMSTNSSPSIGRRCLHCLADKTPQWRAGPMGPKTLCNACGVRYKSGRLVPEYRPASSPTFSAALHSNSHRKVVEMRMQKQMRRVGKSGLCV